MQKFTLHTGIAAILNRINVDTDQIIPKQFLRLIGKDGFGKYLFFNWRFLENGQIDPAFELNNPKVDKASILLAGANFGCGSSREHAVWALADYGLKVVIAPSFGDIFFNNCFKNGVLAVQLTQAEVSSLMAEVQATSGSTMQIDLPNQTLTSPSGKIIKFDITPMRKEFLLKGLDQITYSLQFIDKITSFEAQQKQKLPWLWN